MAHLVWVLNLSPNSFSDGKQWNEEELIARIQELQKDGADIIDIWAEATNPSSCAVTLDEELNRLATFFDCCDQIEIPYSLDTVKSQVAVEGIKHWVTMINDVSGGRFDDEMYSIVADHKFKYVMMYCKNPTWRADLQARESWISVVETIIDFFDQQLEIAYRKWILKDQIIIDPGMWAFISTDPNDSKVVLQSLWLLKERYELPVYACTSRKWFHSKVTYDTGAQDRVWSSIASSWFAILQGADYIRVHDVRWAKQFLDIMQYLDVNEK